MSETNRNTKDNIMKKSSLLRSFGYSIEGLLTAARHERSMRIHLLATILIVALGAWVGLEKWEWVAVVFCCAAVISLECVNTSLEAAVDLVSPEFHPLAKKAKDCAAGAVLASAIGAAPVGTVIFLPKLLALI